MSAGGRITQRLPYCSRQASLTSWSKERRREEAVWGEHAKRVWVRRLTYRGTDLAADGKLLSDGVVPAGTLADSGVVKSGVEFGEVNSIGGCDRPSEKREEKRD